MEVYEKNEIYKKMEKKPTDLSYLKEWARKECGATTTAEIEKCVLSQPAPENTKYDKSGCPIYPEHKCSSGDEEVSFVPDPKLPGCKVPTCVEKANTGGTKAR